MQADLLTSNKRVTVFGAYGHTGRFVAAELCKRGWTAVLAGRNHGKLLAEAERNFGVEVRVANVSRRRIGTYQLVVRENEPPAVITLARQARSTRRLPTIERHRDTDLVRAVPSASCPAKPGRGVLLLQARRLMRATS